MTDTPPPKKYRTPALTEIGRVPRDPMWARAAFGVRFHHFLDVGNGRLVGTVVTIPHPDALINDAGEPQALIRAGTVAHPHDAVTRAGGRLWAWRALLDGRALTLSVVDVQRRIFTRTALAYLMMADGPVPPKVMARIAAANLRPRHPPSPEMIKHMRERRAPRLDEALLAEKAEQIDRSATRVATSEPGFSFEDGGPGRWG